ncbi:MAG: tRNA (N(6)-L-threonylcarbamoyladenosine(37)-C(2))-methylthiotransferase MtaB [Bacteroidetes bacterium]|nr:tRNA (N(6)-L-threonylcarbamoyladenosine(37)-C(2))-methylthiotransferase MtaB [Bacteroidota bacterium]
MLRKIAFHTLGCKLNFSETSDISRSFSEKGFEIVDFSSQADFYVINSCSVTKKAEKKCKSLINQVVKRSPDACVAVIGCFSQINSEELSKIPGVGLVLGNAEKFNLLEHLRDFNSSSKIIPVKKPEYKDLTEFNPTYSIDGRTRSFFKIQDGCDYFCAYCTIPLARGKSRSNTIEETIKVAEEITKADIKEIVLTGVNIGDFGKNNGESFYGLLNELVKIQGIERVRISSVEPDLLSDEIIELVASNEKLMPHFHIPLQAGCNEVLKDMGRRYVTELFSSRIDKIRMLIPHACIAIDLIVGFPSESEALFEKSLKFIEQSDVSYVHVFTYSERDSTRALNIKERVAGKDKSSRSKRMHELSELKQREFYFNNIGRKEKVLWEKENIKGFMYGFTENYIKVKTKFDDKLVNQITEVVLSDLDEGVFNVIM